MSHEGGLASIYMPHHHQVQESFAKSSLLLVLRAHIHSLVSDSRARIINEIWFLQANSLSFMAFDYTIIEMIFYGC